MKRVFTTLILAIFLTAGTTAMVAAASIKCTVETIEDGKVTLQCGDKATELKLDTEVKVKTVKKRKAVEGC